MKKPASHTTASHWESMAGSVIKVIGTMEFEDGLWIGNHLEKLEMVRTISGAQPGTVHTPRFLWRQTELQYTWVRVAAWCPARRWVQFLVAAVLGLTRPREVERFVLFPDVRQNH